MLQEGDCFLLLRICFTLVISFPFFSYLFIFTHLFICLVAFFLFLFFWLNSNKLVKKLLAWQVMQFPTDKWKPPRNGTPTMPPFREDFTTYHLQGSKEAGQLNIIKPINGFKLIWVRCSEWRLSQLKEDPTITSGWRNTSCNTVITVLPLLTTWRQGRV